MDPEPTLPQDIGVTLPSFSMDDVDGLTEMDSILTKEEEDALLRVGV